jgi:hypothetical protein
MARFFREDFNRERDFVVKVGFVFNGKFLAPGFAVDKSSFTVRRLRQMYDQRRIDYASTTVEPEPTPPAVEAALAAVTAKTERVERRRPGGSVERRRPRSEAA